MFGPFNRCEFCKVPDTSFKGVACSRQCDNDYKRLRRYQTAAHYERWCRRDAARRVRKGNYKRRDKVELARRILSGEHVPTPRPGKRVRQIFEERGLEIWWLDER